MIAIVLSLNYFGSSYPVKTFYAGSTFWFNPILVMEFPKFY